SNKATASLALLDCNGPIRCRASPLCLATNGGHFAFASCTRFSPNTRWPAAMTGSIVSALCVFDTATSVTDAGSRWLSRQARAISARTVSSPVVEAAVSICPLYRKPARPANSNKRARRPRSGLFAGNANERGAVDHFKHAVLPAHGLGGEKAPQRLVGMDQRHAERIGEMLLREGKLNGAVLDQPRLLGTDEQMQQQICDALQRGAAAEADQIFVDQLLFARGEPGDVEGKRRKAAVKVVQLRA